MGVVPKHIWEYKTDAKSSWKKPRLEDFTDKPWTELSASEKRSIAAHFAWAAEMPPEKFSDLKLPHHDPKSHNVVWNGVRAAMAALLGARGGTRIPKEDKKRVYNHLAKHYKEFDKEPPEFHFSLDSVETTYTFEKQGETLVIEGTILYPGEFIPMDGIPVAFSEEDIHNIVENTELNIPIKLTHFSDQPIGYVTKMWVDYQDVDEDNDPEPVIKIRGYVFTEHENILNGGFHKMSMEYDAIESKILAVAFVSKPAVPKAEPDKMEVIAMQRGVCKNVDDDFDEQPMTLRDYLKSVGLTDEQIAKALEFAESGKFGSEEEYMEYIKLKEMFEAQLAEELKELNIENPEELLSFAKSVDEKVALVKKVKEIAAFSEPPVTTDVEIPAEDERPNKIELYKQLADRFGLPFDELKDRIMRYV